MTLLANMWLKYIMHLKSKILTLQGTNSLWYIIADPSYVTDLQFDEGPYLTQYSIFEL